MVVKTYGAAVIGVNAYLVTIEVAITNGTQFHISGLPDNAVKQSEHRINSVVQLAGYKMPRRQVIINLAPADVRKIGCSYDLAMALGILSASGQIASKNLENHMIMGELSLDGTVMPVKGVLPIAIEAKKRGFSRMILPNENAEEAAVIGGVDIFGVSSFREALECLGGRSEKSPLQVDTEKLFGQHMDCYQVDFEDVQGQENIKRALEIAAAGGHNVIMIGPPGAGKTMLARRLPTILPPLSLEESLETTKIHSVAGKLNGTLIASRPFRSPHHTTSDVALVGGGAIPQPGEISLAHNGVLFLDELPEFKRSVLEVMRQPMEERKVTISRARFSVDYPANFMLIASMNPCPCGYYNHPDKACLCRPDAVFKYISRVSGPLLDRIDLHVEVTPVSFDEMTNKRISESSDNIRKRVIRARSVQAERYRTLKGIHANALMPVSRIKEICTINVAGKALLKTAMERLGLSARAYDRILKVARTIADLDGSARIETGHLAEAIQFRNLDRQEWSG